MHLYTSPSSAGFFEEIITSFDSSDKSDSSVNTPPSIRRPGTRHVPSDSEKKKKRVRSDNTNLPIKEKSEKETLKLFTEDEFFVMNFITSILKGIRVCGMRQRSDGGIRVNELAKIASFKAVPGVEAIIVKIGSNFRAFSISKEPSCAMYIKYNHGHSKNIVHTLIPTEYMEIWDCRTYDTDCWICIEIEATAMSGIIANGLTAGSLIYIHFKVLSSRVIDTIHLKLPYGNFLVVMDYERFAAMDCPILGFL